MADPQDQPKRGAAGIPPPPRKAPVKKTPAQKTPARKTTSQPALGTPPAQTAGDSAARQAAAANATASVQRADNPAVLRSTPAGDYRLPISLGLAAAGLVALVLSRLRRG
jgi:hypothetical protein